MSNMYPSQKYPGYGVFVKNVCDGLEQYGITVTNRAVIKGKDGGVGGKIFRYFVFYLRIFFYYFSKSDCLYVHFPNQASPILSFLQKIKRKPMVINYHGEDLLYDENVSASSYFGHVSDELAKKAAFIVVPSQYYKDIVIERGLNVSGKIVISPSGGINEKVFYYTGPKNKHDFLHLGFVGRLEKDKGVFEFIDACILLSEALKIKATIIGYGPLQDVVEEKTKDNHIFNVKFGVPQEELPMYYREFDLFCFPSFRKTESLGLVGIEAMACGTPVLGGNIGGIKSYIEHGKNGFLMELDSMVEEMVRYSLEYHNMNAEKKKSIVASALQTAKRFYRDAVCNRLAHEFMQRIIL